MLRDLMIQTLARPRDAARAVLALDLDMPALAQAAGAVTCIGLVLGYTALMVSGAPVDPISAAVLEAPLFGAALQFGAMATIAVLTWRIGALFGGKGGFRASALAVVWLNAVMLVIQVAQIVALALAPPLAGIIAAVTLFWLFWAYSNFVTELHEFKSPVMVLGVVVLAMIVIVFGLTLLAAILGLAPRGV